MLIIDMKITSAPINLPTLRYRSHLTHHHTDIRASYFNFNQLAISHFQFAFAYVIRTR